MKNKLTIGTRGSELALWQANYIGNLLKSIYADLEINYKIITTKGDQILDKPLHSFGGKGIFTKELEIELSNGTIDIAVHSLKDMPTVQPDDLSIIAYSKRGPVHDVLLSKNPISKIDEIPLNSKIATGSIRRKAQLLWLLPDLEIIDIRGNITTRINKFNDSDCFGLVLAAAGLERLSLTGKISYHFPMKEILPAVGQGVLCVEGRSNDKQTIELLSKLNDVETELCVQAERTFLKALGGGCKTPIAAYCALNSDRLQIEGLVANKNGTELINYTVYGQPSEAKKLGYQLAKTLISFGASKYLE